MAVNWSPPHNRLLLLLVSMLRSATLVIHIGEAMVSGKAISHSFNGGTVFKVLTRLGGIVLVVLVLPLSSLGQSRLVISDDAYIRIDNGAWVVVDNAAPNAITSAGTGANIRSEGEFNRVRWQMRDNVGTYVVPFTSVTGTKIPFTYTVLTAGSADPQASVVFSTYNHALMVGPAVAWNNDLYRPSDVIHMFSYNEPSIPNSQNAVDRFWIVDPTAGPYAYSTKPAVELGFTYENNAADGEVMLGNAIGPGDPVGAQRFNPGPGLWGDFLPVGNWAGGALGSVTNAVVPAGDFHRSWTLANLSEPLPVELLSFEADCVEKEVVLRWSTATERNSDYFQVERSVDGVSFVSLDRVQAAGYSLSTQEYRYVDKEAHALAYYRLRQVDFDGTQDISTMVGVECRSMRSGLEIVNAWDNGIDLSVVIQGPEGTQPDVQLLDGRGKIIQTERVTLGSGLTVVNMPKRSLAQGVYLVRVESNVGGDARRVTLVF